MEERGEAFTDVTTIPGILVRLGDIGTGYGYAASAIAAVMAEVVRNPE